MTTKNIPEPKKRETRKEYRLRFVLWLVKNNPGWTYEQIVSEHNKLAEVPSAKESIVRDLKTLELREEVYREMSEVDGRMRQWYAFE